MSSNVTPGQGTIDVHAHFLPPVYRQALQDAGLATLDGGIPVPQWTPERALRVMDELGIAGAMLSVSSPMVGFLDSAAAVALCRAVNDYAAELKQRHPQRFGAYAILPLADVAASLTEMERALHELQLDGVALPTHVAGRYLGDPCLGALFEALDAHGTTVFIHPTSPDCFASLGLGLPAPMIEFPFDTTRTATSLLYSGTLARHRRIRFILPHGGGTLPFLAPRIAAIGSLPVLGDRALPEAQAMAAFADLFYDTAFATAPAQFAALRALARITQVVYGSDYPFAPEVRVRAAEAAFDALPLTPDEKTLVRQGNAARLFPVFAQHCCGHA